MSNDINLVSSKTYEFEKELKRLKALKLIAIGFLASVSLISVVIFIITLIVPISSVKKNQDQTLANIATLHQKFAKYSLINDRVNNISSIIKSRKNYAKLATSILDKLPAGLAVDSMTIEGGTFTLTVSGSSLAPMDAFIESVRTLGDKESIIKNLVIGGLTASVVSGKFTLSLQADTL